MSRRTSTSRSQGDVAKRAFDLVVTAAALPVALPVMALTAAAVRLRDGRPILYRAPRMGRGGQPFIMLKFRTMREDLGDDVRVTAATDPRLTPIGSTLRRLKLDELPQLINVLRGDMSLVGPRPEDPRFAGAYTEEERELFLHRPGMTSPTALRFRNEEDLLAGAPGDTEDFYVREILHRKLAMDLAYVRERSLRRDIRILMDTVRMIWGADPVVDSGRESR